MGLGEKPSHTPTETALAKAIFHIVYIKYLNS